MGHLSVAAHDYLLTRERGRWAAGRGEEGVGAGRLSCRPGDLWQVSAARFPDRSSGLEFIWVTATGVVCCDKRLMGRAPGSCLGSSVWRGARPWGSCRLGSGVARAAGRRGAGLHPPATAPRPSLTKLPLPSLSAPAAWCGEGAGAIFCHGTPSQNPFIPGLQPSRCLPSPSADSSGHGDHLPVGSKGSSSGTPCPTATGGRTGPLGPQSSSAGSCAEPRRKMFLSVASCSHTFLFNIHAPK